MGRFVLFPHRIEHELLPALCDHTRTFVLASWCNPEECAFGKNQSCKGRDALALFILRGPQESVANDYLTTDLFPYTVDFHAVLSHTSKLNVVERSEWTGRKGGSLRTFDDTLDFAEGSWLLQKVQTIADLQTVPKSIKVGADDDQLHWSVQLRQARHHVNSSAVLKL